MDTPIDATDQSWRAWVNLHLGTTLEEPCPTWATPAQQQLWRKPGLILWNDTAQRVTHLTKYDMVSVLHVLHTTTTWQHNGIDVGTMIPTHPLSDELPTQIRPGTLTHLNAAEAQRVFTILRPYEAELHREQQLIKAQVSAGFLKFATSLARRLREKDLATMDFAARPLPWVAADSPLTWCCDLPPNRVTISVLDTGEGWHGCLERPQQFKRWSPPFARLVDVVTWAEQELVSAAAIAAQHPTQARTLRLSLATLTPAHRKRLKPFWIAPSVLEPPRLTYRTVIYLEHVCIKRKVMELSFGERWYYGEEYPSAAQLARKLNVNTDQDEIYPMRKLYRITSLATYAQASLASQQAQVRWDRSTIAAAYRDQQLIYAAYGIEEVETSYRTWSGGVGDWSCQIEDRDTFMAEGAFELTLIHALDVAGYRAVFSVLPSEYDSDTALLVYLHEQRAQSPHIPATARAESAQWLQEHRTTDLHHQQPVRTRK